MITLSVHLITFNNEKYIDQTIQSLLRQNVDFEWEIVVGDDCSTDRTFEIITHYANQNPNLFKIKQNSIQHGILANYKSTLDRCEGLYLFDLAGDDLLKGTTALQKLVDVLKNNPSLGFVDSGYDEFIDKRNITHPFVNSDYIKEPKVAYKKHVLLGKLSTIGMCFNKSYLNKYVDFNRYLELNITIDDYPILADLCMNTDFERIDESLHIYRVHDHSYSNQKSFEKLYFQKNQMKRLFDFFANKYNYQETVIREFDTNYNKDLLFLAGYYEQKTLGKELFEKIENKSFYDVIYYCSSQFPILRKLLLFGKKGISRILQ